MIHITRAMLASLVEARAMSIEGFMEGVEGAPRWIRMQASPSLLLLRTTDDVEYDRSSAGETGGFMKWMARVGMAAWIAGVVTSCSSAPRPVPVTGEGPALNELAGQWSGEYHATAGEREGTILFKLVA